MRRFLRPYRGSLAIAAAVEVAAIAIDLARPWPLKLAVDNAIGRQQPGGWLSFLGGHSAFTLAAVAAGAVVALVGLSGLLGYLSDFLVGASAERVGADVRTAAFARLQRLSLRFHDRHRSGDLVTRLVSDVSRVQDSMVAWWTTVLPEGLTLLGMLVVIFAIDRVLAGAALAVVPVLLVLVMWSKRRIRAAQRTTRDRYGRLATRATEVLRHVRAVQAFSQEEDETRRFRDDSVAATRSALRSLDIEARYRPAADMVLAVGSALVLLIGVVRVTEGRMSLGVLLVVLSYLANLYGPIRSLSRLTSVLARGAASRERLDEVFDEAEAVQEDPYPQLAPPLHHGVAWRDVTFSYLPDQTVLRDLTLEVEAGEVVCVVGPTGAGKSTLLALLLRLYDPEEGRVEMDGVDIRRLSLRSLRDRVALVPQDPWILDGSIADNISFGRPDATWGAIRAAGEAALVDEFASDYDRAVGEGGGQLSGGQRRRIAIARAILRDAALLLLDEPTSGLDAESEAAVMRTLRRVARGRTMLILSHRLNLASLADRVVFLEGGHVVETGAPDELEAAGGAFARFLSASRP